MLEALRAHGAHDYVISVDEATLELFGSLLIEDEARWAAIAETDVCKRWWAACAELLECEDGRPKAVSLREMFFFKGA